MSAPNGERLRAIKTFPQLVKYLRDELEWPIESANFEDLSFDFTAEELGIDPKTAAKIQEIKQLRPLTTNQPWGIFFVKFEPKRLPIVALRKILSRLVLKKRATANKAERAAWNLHDLLFISAVGEGADRQITLAHFSEGAAPTDLPALKVIDWDELDTQLKLQDQERLLREKLHWPSNPAVLDAWRKQWSSAFVLRPRQIIATAKDLAIRLADLARAIRDKARQVLEIETEQGALRKLYLAFQKALIHDLSEDDFADMYAQTITYGLFSAAVSRTTPDAGTLVLAENLADMVPITNPFLKEMLATFLTVGGRKGKFDFDELGIQDVVELLNSSETNLYAVLRDFGNRGRGEDPVIHFYEDFLRVYDKKRKVQRGVFYTPQPVVSYIVRSVHELLQTEFGLAEGLADTAAWGEMAKKNPGLKIPDGVKPSDPFVQILDPATGTATFLVEVIDLIHRTLTAKWKQQSLTDAEQRAAWNDYVPKHLLPRLHGYELMMAPYAIAHMKIGLKLTETGYHFQSNERARIYLTNALEPPQEVSGYFEEMAPALAHEAQAVNQIKRHQRFTVVMGNPPYSLLSANMEPQHRSLVERFKFIGTERVRERGALQLEKILNDDYVKFMAKAEDSLATTGFGLLGLITNHAYLDNPTMRGLRHTLITSFQRAFLYDLRGSTKKSADEVDQNVFDIQQGVAIGLFGRNANRAKGIQHAHLSGTRESKYHTLGSSSVSGTEWTSVSPTPPFYLLVTTDYHLRAEYEEFVPLAEIFGLKSIGLFTSKDSLVLDSSPEAVEQKVRAFQQSRLSNKELCEQVGITAKAAWNVTKSRQRLRGLLNLRQHIVRFLHRPFDYKYLFYERSLVWSMAWPVNQNLLRKRNLALTVSRQLAAPPWNHVFCSNTIVELCYITNKTKEGNHVFPLYVLPNEEHEQRSFDGHNMRVNNFREPFLGKLLTALGLSVNAKEVLPQGLTPEDIFHYAYAVFHSPTYRNRYAAFLKIDFPRAPLPGSLELFRALVRQGAELVALHLLESPRVEKPRTEFIGGRKPEVEKVSWSKQSVWIDKAQTTGFKGVPEAVWNFHIGGYQVCEKWLKDRKGRTLSKDDILHYHKIVVALAETIRLMREIDEVIDKHGGWPGAFAGAAAEVAKS